MAPSISYQCADLLINHDIADNLDSSDAFEGPEKLLELWLLPIPNLPNNGLRSVPLAEIEDLLLLINCKILSRVSSQSMDSYLLSESSLFVFNHKIILKTCGTTTTLLCLEKLFQLVSKYLEWDLTTYQPFKIFYSRRSFMFPEKQVELHRNWNNEITYLDKFFPNGDSYIVGKSNKDHWHLFTAGIGFNNVYDLAVNSLLASAVSKRKIIAEFSDQTFEILMTELSQECAQKFNTQQYAPTDIEFDGHKIGALTFRESGLSDIYEIKGNNTISSNCFSFNPCGFSSNSIINDDSYYTLHITPERGWSYASFETNVNPFDHNTNNLVVLHKILNIFKPGKLCFTIFELKDEFAETSTKTNGIINGKAIGDSNNKELNNLQLLEKVKIDGYKRVEKIAYDVDEYELLYVNFERI